MASNKPLPLAVVSIIRYPGKHDSASQESLLSLFGPPSLLANDKYFKIFTLPKISGAPGAPPLDPLLEFYVGKFPRRRACERAVVLKWFYSLRRRKTFVGGKCALPSAVLYDDFGNNVDVVVDVGSDVNFNDCFIVALRTELRRKLESNSAPRPKSVAELAYLAKCERSVVNCTSLQIQSKGVVGLHCVPKMRLA